MTWANSHSSHTCAQSQLSQLSQLCAIIHHTMPSNPTPPHPTPPLLTAQRSSVYYPTPHPAPNTAACFLSATHLPPPALPFLTLLPPHYFLPSLFSLFTTASPHSSPACPSPASSPPDPGRGGQPTDLPRLLPLVPDLLCAAGIDAGLGPTWA